MQKIDAYGLTMCTVKATLAAGTTTTYSTTGATAYCIRGKAYSVAAATNAATPTTDINTGAAFTPVLINQGSVFVFGYNAAGALAVAQGSVEALDNAANFISYPKFPGLPDNFCPFGYLVLKMASNGSTWTFGSSNLSGVTGATYTFVDVMTLPDHPQIS